MRPAPRWLLLWLLLPWLLPSGPAWAHAALVSTVPQDGAVLAGPPAGIELRFDEAVSLIGFSVIGPAGPVALAGPARIEGNVLRARLPETLAPGTYLASWRVISADGHPVGGSIAFGIGIGIGTAPDAAALLRLAADPGWAASEFLQRFLVHAALLFGAGGALFRLLVAEPPARVRQWQAGLAMAGVPCALLAIGVQGGTMLAAPFPAGLFDAGTWRAALGSTPTLRAIGVATGLAMAWAGLQGTAPPARALGAGGVALAAGCLALSGHAAAGGTAMQALLAAHALAGCFWLGALPPLLGLLARGDGSATAALRRFSVLALPAVALLLLAGVVQGARHLPDPGALVASRYGLLLLAKTLLFALLLALAALNRRRLVPALAAGRAEAVPPLRRSIRGEVALGAAVLGVTAVLAMTNPHLPAGAAHHHDHAHADHAHPDAQGLVVHAGHQDLALTLAIDPARPGTNRLVLQLARANGGALAALEVSIELAHEAAGVAAVRRRLLPAGPGFPGRYEYQGPELAVPGRWTARLHVLVGDFDLLVVPLAFDIASPT
jgi:copper transport protein